MAIEAERLLAIFEARFTSLEKALVKARGDSQKAFSDIEKAGTKAENALAKVGSRGTPGIDKMAQSMGAAKAQTANLAAQFQDIAVQLQGGASPFTVALQQGTQITAALGGSGARGAVAALGGAFASLLNPVSLATIAIIGLGGTAVQYFLSLASGGEKSAETLKREADLVNQVAKEWGDALPALKAYAEEREKLANSEAQRQATDVGLGAAYGTARSEVRELNIDLADFLAMMQSFGGSETEVARLQDAFGRLQTAIQEQKGGVEEATAVNAALADLFDKTSIPAADALAKKFLEIAGALQTASEKAVQLRADLALQDFYQRDPLGGLSPVYSGGGNFIDENQLQTDRANETKSQYQIQQEAMAKSRSRAASEAEREAKAVLDLIEALEFEQSMVGATDLQREQANAIRRAGAAATDEQKAKINELVAATYAEKEAIKQQELAYQTLQQVGQTALNGIQTALADGKIEGRELLSILFQVAQQLLTMKGFNFLSFLGGSGGGFNPSPTGFADMLGIPAYANGTSNHPGGLALIGENGPEVLNLPRGSKVSPKIPSVGPAGQASATYAPVLQIDARGAQAGVGAEIEAAVKRATAQMQKDMPVSVAKALKVIKLMGLNQ